MDKITKDIVLEAIKGSGGIVSPVARKLGLGWAATQKHINEWPETIAAMQNEEERALDDAEETLYKAANAGKLWAIRFLLATFDERRRYSEQQALSGKVRAPFQLLLKVDPAKLTDEELDVFKMNRSMPPEVITIEL